jgi:hypothetical protein
MPGGTECCAECRSTRHRCDLPFQAVLTGLLPVCGVSFAHERPKTMRGTDHEFPDPAISALNNDFEAQALSTGRPSATIAATLHANRGEECPTFRAYTPGFFVAPTQITQTMVILPGVPAETRLRNPRDNRHVRRLPGMCARSRSFRIGLSYRCAGENRGVVRSASMNPGIVPPGRPGGTCRTCVGAVSEAGKIGRIPPLPSQNSATGIRNPEP